MADELFKTADLTALQPETTASTDYQVQSAITPAQTGLFSTAPATSETTTAATTAPAQESGLLSDAQAAETTTASQTQADTVAQQLNALLETNNPYLVAARESSQRASASRGLQNSSIAATAGEKAAIESALPIATQDASYYQQQGLNEQTTANQKELYQTQGDISSQLSAQEHAQALETQAIEMEWNKLDLQQRIDLEYDQMEETAKENFNTLVNQIGEDYMNDFMELAVNPNFDTDADRQKAIDILTETYNQRYQMAAELAGYELEWETPTTEYDVNEPTQAGEFDPPGTWSNISPGDDGYVLGGSYVDGEGNVFDSNGSYLGNQDTQQTGNVNLV